jgi:hypothetical protein
LVRIVDEEVAEFPLLAIELIVWKAKSDRVVIYSELANDNV